MGWFSNRLTLGEAAIVSGTLAEIMVKEEINGGYSSHVQKLEVALDTHFPNRKVKPGDGMPIVAQAIYNTENHRASIDSNIGSSHTDRGNVLSSHFRDTTLLAGHFKA